ncbi:MAG TPA: hypothetical protein VLH19_05680 [Patescibacteria group bacterium]|nr:hypothetical protein [Patescibacteria group bacterium]
MKNLAGRLFVLFVETLVVYGFLLIILAVGLAMMTVLVGWFWELVVMKVTTVPSLGEGGYFMIAVLFTLLRRPPRPDELRLSFRQLLNRLED